MRTKKFRWAARAALVVVAAFLSCDCPITPEEEEDGELPSGEIEERSELFIEQEDSPGKFVFLTNDEDLWGPYGSTLWALTGSEQDPFEEREIQLAKYSGNGTAGFGVIICHREDEEYGETMLVVMINTNRQFIVGEVIGAEFQVIVAWTDCEALVAGYTVNTMSLRYEDKSFIVSFNGKEACRFQDQEAPQHTGGNNGLIVVISPLDDFPNTAVHVVFQDL
jgi:hypothetical protein